jgi:hypothetical protein
MSASVTRSALSFSRDEFTTSTELAWRAAKAHAEIAKAVDQANRRAERWRDVDAPDDLAAPVCGLLEQHPSMSWDLALRRLAEDRP